VSDFPGMQRMSLCELGSPVDEDLAAPACLTQATFYRGCSPWRRLCFLRISDGVYFFPEGAIGFFGRFPRFAGKGQS